MTDTIKILGQAAPAATTETDLYVNADRTVADITQTTCSTLVVCNRGTAAATFRVSVSEAGAATATKDYLFYDAPLEPNATLTITIGITLNQTDEVRVYASTADLSFNLFGVETS